jgi:hypothetical protein
MGEWVNGLMDQYLTHGRTDPAANVSSRNRRRPISGTSHADARHGSRADPERARSRLFGRDDMTVAFGYVVTPGMQPRPTLHREMGEWVNGLMDQYLTHGRTDPAANVSSRNRREPISGTSRADARHGSRADPERARSRLFGRDDRAKGH